MNVTVIDQFEFVRKVDGVLKSLGYETGSANGEIGRPYESPNGISVLYKDPNPSLLDRLLFSHARLVHCYLSWDNSHRSIRMRVPGRGKNGEHLEEMKTLAMRLNNALGTTVVTVELISEDSEYDFGTQVSARM